MSEEKISKDWAVENFNSLGRVRLIEVYRKNNAQDIADAANASFEAQGVDTRSEVVPLHG